MTEEQHRAERRYDETRWQWVLGLLVTIAIASVTHGITALLWAGRMDERVGAASAELVVVETSLGQALTRIAALEANREGASVEIVAARRDIADLKQDVRALSSLVTTAIRNGAFTP